MTLIRTSGVWPVAVFFDAGVATAIVETWPRRLANGSPLTRAACRRADTERTISAVVVGFVARL